MTPDGPGADELTVRRATAADAVGVADIYLSSIHATYDFPLAHTDEEVRGWVASDLLPTSETWVAVRADRLIGFISIGADAVDQLYVAPGETGRGFGGRLLALAKERRPAGLHLYTFQVNAGARRFYERHGFNAEWLGDGSANEEGQPDVRYRWR